MQSIDREAFAQTLTSALAMYDREVTDQAIDTWMSTLKAHELGRVRQAIRDHMDHHEDGKRAPRPVDIWRRLNAGGGRGVQCAASSSAGRCRYPGVFSDATDGTGQWWCPWHRENREGVKADEAIEASANTPFDEAQRHRIARLNAEACASPSVRRLREQMSRRQHEVPAIREPGQDDAEEAAA